MPYTHVPYNAPLGLLPTILMCLVITLTYWCLSKPEDTFKQKRRRREKLVVRVRAKCNWKGIPPDNLKRQEVWDRIKIVPMATEFVSTHCPKCGLVLSPYKSDFDVKTCEFRVTGKFCREGHWTYLTWRPTNLDRRF